MASALALAPLGKTTDEILPQALACQPEYIIVMTATVAFQAAMANGEVDTLLIFFNRHVPAGKTSSVTCDNAKGGWDIADFLLQTGHRKMAYIAGTPDASTSIDRGSGFAKRCAVDGLTVAEVKDAKVFSYHDGYAEAHRLLSRTPDLDAIFCANDLVALGAIDALRYDLGLGVPDDISVVGFDDVSMASWPSHVLTTYRHPVQRMVTAMVNLNKQVDADPDCEAIAKFIPGELVIRKTHKERRR